jgi:acetyltransferase-like isoleucine patch superfamily enzyme
VKIGLGAHPTDRVSTSPIFYSNKNPFRINLTLGQQEFNEYKNVKIENDVWIGANVIILGGVKISNGAIIAAGSVVTKDVNPYEIVGGVPAKLIKKRFDNNTIEILCNSKWWEEELDLIKVNIVEMNDVNKFCQSKKFKEKIKF